MLRCDGGKRGLTRRDALTALLGGLGWQSVATARQGADSPDDLIWLDVVTIVARMRAGTLSAADLTDAYLRRIERLNPILTAYVTVAAARAQRDARRLAGVSSRAGRGVAGDRPLYGVPIAHKDLFETAGIRTTGGSRLFERHIPKRDAVLVSRFDRAGSVLLGKANTHELGGGVTTINPFFGTTRNPWHTSRIAGGSSGGSAAAVAAGLAAAATGSDTGGSVRIPAALCGCVGFKPTFGRVSTAGLLGACPTFDHSGFLTRTVEDAELVFRATRGDDLAKPSMGSSTRSGGADSARTRFQTDTPGVAAVRVGVARNFFFEALQADVARAIERALRTFREANAELRDIAFPIGAGTMAQVFDPIIVAEIQQHYGRDWQARPDAFSPSFAALFKAPTPSPGDVASAHHALREYQTAVGQIFETVDVVVTPTVPMTAPPIAGPVNGTLLLRNTWPFNAARTPAISVPCGFDSDDLPIGLQIVTALDDEATMFAVARAYQRLTDWHLRRPRLVR